MQYFKELDNYTKLVDEELSSLVFRNIRVYPLLRRGLTQKYLITKDAINISNHKKHSLTDIFLIAKGALRSLFNVVLLLLSGKKKFVFMGFSRRSTTANGESLDKFHDPLIELLAPEDCVMIERPFKFTHSKNRKTQCRVVDFDFVVYLSFLVGFILSFYYRLFYSKDIKEVVSKFNGKFDFEITNLRALTLQIGVFKAEKFFAQLILNKLKPEKLVVTSRWLHYGFIAVAKEKNIEVIELQHGSILKSNIFYQKLDEGLLSPDTMFTFSEYWNDRDWNASKVLAIGNASFNFDLAEPVAVNKKVLVISQPEMQSKLIGDLRTLSKNNIDFQFVVKLHPQDVDHYEMRYAELVKCENVSFISESNTVLNDVLKMFDLVIGYNSTVLFEAYDYGHSVGLLCSESITWDDYNSYFGSACELFVRVDIDSGLLVNNIERLNDGPVFYKALDKGLVRRYFYEANF